ncbi:hypothetical protein [Rhodophyticola porphyridii]|uniref:hypothetical protein n=1 Tax=Rhodophyticola porphyridii TaxID=1852017 RepID=UPI001B1847DC|nr:hypothetical protein [Roseicyclus sp.]MBO6624947.1 hypothetical protein [Roseicyclus sp.]MBO6921225.1 hypothetical protein [Roseicyclus sp.]
MSAGELARAARPMRHRARLAGIFAAALTALPAGAQDAASILALICGRTVHYFSPELGNQIEYTAPDGSAYLWHSGNEGLVLGTWEVTEITPDIGEVCYVYRPGSFGADDPGSEFCFDWEMLISDVPQDGVRDGDPYNLASGLRPFALPFTRPVSVAALRTEFPDQPPERACGTLMM